jgi:hypothetical protein
LTSRSVVTKALNGFLEMYISAQEFEVKL